MADLSGMSVRQMKEELASMGLSAAGCVERGEIEAKLRKARSSTPAPTDGGTGGGQQAAAGGAGGDNPFASMASNLQGVFDNVGGSFSGMMGKLTTKFDEMDSRLDGLEEQRRKLKQTINAKEPETPLGRLNKLKAAAGAHELEQKLEETKEQTQKDKRELTAQVQKESVSAMQGLMMGPK